MHKATASFIFLFLLAVVLTVASYVASKKQTVLPASNQQAVTQNTPEDSNKKLKPMVSHADEIAMLPTNDWKEYSDKTLLVTFKYPPTWGVSGGVENGYQIINVAPKGGEGIKIYTSVKNYFAVEGLPIEKTTVDNLDAISVDSVLLGVKSGNTYFTFDAGTDSKNLPYFKTLLSTVTFP
jgi:hypothetical protein